MMRISMVILTGLGAAGCLNPPDEEFLLLTGFEGDINDAPLVSELPDYDTRQDEFTQNVEYLRGFAAGSPVWFWSVDGANSTLIAPAFFIVDSEGSRLQPPIIDVLPGDPGYTPWWRMIMYTVTDLWDGEVFTSRAAVDAGERTGLLEGPNTTNRIVNAPVAVPNVRAFDGERLAVRTSTIWYRDFAAHWIPFNQGTRVDPSERQMPMLPVYVLRRIQETVPLDEFGSGVDLTGDGRLNDSNNIFAAALGTPEYTPLWFKSDVRTVQDYVSIDTNPPDRDVGLSAESDFYDRASGQIISEQVLFVERDMEQLRNCPIQSERGSFP